MTRFLCVVVGLLSITLCAAQPAKQSAKPAKQSIKSSKQSSKSEIPDVLAVEQSRVVYEKFTLDSMPKFWSWMQPRKDERLELKYVDGGMYLRQTTAGSLWFLHGVPADATKDWEVTMHTKGLTAVTKGGPGIHVRSGSMHYMFIISSLDGSFWVGQYNAATGQWAGFTTATERSMNYVKNDNIKGRNEINELTVRKHGSVIDFSANGVLLNSYNIGQSMPGLLTDLGSFGINISDVVEASIFDIAFRYSTRSINYDSNAFVGATKSYASELNSIPSDRYPVLAPNGSSIYWVRTPSVNNDDIMIASRATDSTWTNVRAAGRPLNNYEPNNVIAVSQDDNSLFLWSRYRPDGSPAGPGFSRSTRTATGWTVPTSVAIKNYYTRANTREECVSADRAVAIMSCQRDDTRGLKDLYISFLEADGSYSEPRNMGDNINTQFEDGMPHLAADNKTLYFASTRPGFGELDMWVSKRLDSTWLNWSKPINLGPTINSNGWNGYLCVHPSGKYAYMNTTDGERNGIFRLNLPQDPASRRLLPDPSVLVRGRVLNAKTLQPIATTVAIATLPDKKNTAKASSEPSEGRYSIILPGGESYGFYASEPGYFPVSDNLDLKDLSLYREIERDLLLWPIEIGATIRLNNVFFDTNKSNLRNESREELLRLITMLKERPTMTIELGGHTDDRASDALNNKLSEDRAQAVKTYLVSKGITPDRLKAKGYGKTRPVSEDTTEAARQANRRVEFTIASI